MRAVYNHSGEETGLTHGAVCHLQQLHATLRGAPASSMVNQLIPINTYSFSKYNILACSLFAIPPNHVFTLNGSL